MADSSVAFIYPRRTWRAGLLQNDRNDTFGAGLIVPLVAALLQSYMLGRHEFVRRNRRRSAQAKTTNLLTRVAGGRIRCRALRPDCPAPLDTGSTARALRRSSSPLRFLSRAHGGGAFARSWIVARCYRVRRRVARSRSPAFRRRSTHGSWAVHGSMIPGRAGWIRREASGAGSRSSSMKADGARGVVDTRPLRRVADTAPRTRLAGSGGCSLDRRPLVLHGGRA